MTTRYTGLRVVSGLGVAIARLLNALPSAGGYVGEQVILTTDRHVYEWDGAVWNDLGTAAPSGAGSPSYRTACVTFDGGGSTPTVGSVGYLVAPFAGTIDRWYIVANASGSAVVDVWKAAAAIPTDADRIAGTEKPTLSAAQLASDTSLTTWSTLAVSVGDVFGFELESVTTCTRVTVEVRILES